MARAPKYVKRKATKMTTEAAPAGTPDPELELLKEKMDIKNDVHLQIEGDGDGQTIHITLRAPKAADVIEKMATANFPKDRVDKCFLPILAPLPFTEPDAEALEKMTAEEKKKLEARRVLVKTNFLTRPAIAKISTNFAASGDWDWEGKPSSLLAANPEALRTGFTVTRKVDKPLPPDLLRRWGKQIIDGFADILGNARPFRMTWSMRETPEMK